MSSNIPKKKNKRVTTVRMNKDEVEDRIKSTQSPFIRDRTSVSSSLSSVRQVSQIQSLPCHVSGSRPATSARNTPTKVTFTPSRLPGRACEHWDRVNTPIKAPRVKGCSHDHETVANCNDQAEAPMVISYNRCILDHFEKDRYAHPNYQVYFPNKKKEIKIDARYGQ